MRWLVRELFFFGLLVGKIAQRFRFEQGERYGVCGDDKTINFVVFCLPPMYQSSLSSSFSKRSPCSGFAFITSVDRCESICMNGMAHGPCAVRTLRDDVEYSKNVFFGRESYAARRDFQICLWYKT